MIHAVVIMKWQTKGKRHLGLAGFCIGCSTPWMVLIGHSLISGTMLHIFAFFWHVTPPEYLINFMFISFLGLLQVSIFFWLLGCWSYGKVMNLVSLLHPGKNLFSAAFLLYQSALFYLASTHFQCLLIFVSS